jgi:hypothetical protein
MFTQPIHFPGQHDSSWIHLRLGHGLPLLCQGSFSAWDFWFCILFSACSFLRDLILLLLVHLMLGVCSCHWSALLVYRSAGHRSVSST